jgi:hypothetical protein
MIVPNPIDKLLCHLAAIMRLPNEPKINPMLVYERMRPLLYINPPEMRERSFLCETGNDNANGPHIPMQCRLPANPIIKAGPSISALIDI